MHLKPFWKRAGREELFQKVDGKATDSTIFPGGSIGKVRGTCPVKNRPTNLPEPEISTLDHEKAGNSAVGPVFLELSSGRPDFRLLYIGRTQRASSRSP
jgi:hypothetical protein